MPSRLLAFAQLVRLPNVFTAFADILLAACVANLFDWRLAPLLAASGCLYLSGMAWNDFFDHHDDARTRPSRPLPSGRIRPQTAALMAAGLMLAGVGFAFGVGVNVGVTASILAGLIVLYDAVLKHYWLGPVGMGGCRFLNVLMGTLAVSAAEPLLALHVAAVVGLYIVGVTWFARTEEGTSKRRMLIAASAVMTAALALAAVVPLHFEPGRTPWYFLYLLVGFGFMVGGPVVAAVREPSPKNVQAAVKRCILGLVLLDAILATAFVGWLGLLIVLLLVPAVLLGKRVYST
ncbi:MAG: UbiA family prenyltransferase [Fimbriiglobus sp.]|jgi:4-hydroxybenzoate polyprenyltransferase|nr:UbiA family prenyltransferase [Fimbriiglobus sp.]